MSMLPQTIINDEGFSLALHASEDNASEQTRRIIDMNGSHRNKHLDMKGMGTQAQINNTALLSLIAGSGQALIFSATKGLNDNDKSVDHTQSHESGLNTPAANNDIAGQAASLDDRLDIQLLENFGADIIEVKDMALAISYAMESGLTAENPEITAQISQAVAQLSEIKTLSEILKDAPENTAVQERLENLIEDLSQTIEGLAQTMPLHSTALALQISRGLSTVIAPVQDLIQPEILSQVQAQTAKLESRQETIANILVASATIAEILDTPELRESLSDSEIEALEAQLETLEAAEAELEQAAPESEVEAVFDSAQTAVEETKTVFSNLIENAQASASPSLLVFKPTLMQAIDVQVATAVQNPLPRGDVKTSQTTPIAQAAKPDSFSALPLAGIARPTAAQQLQTKANSIAQAVLRSASVDVAKPLAAAILTIPARQTESVSAASSTVNKALTQAITKTAAQENLPPKLQSDIAALALVLTSNTPNVSQTVAPANTASDIPSSPETAVNDNQATSPDNTFVPTDTPLPTGPIVLSTGSQPEQIIPTPAEAKKDEATSVDKDADAVPDNGRNGECPGGGACKCAFEDAAGDKPTSPPVPTERLLELEAQDKRLETFLKKNDTQAKEADQDALNELIEEEKQTGEDPKPASNKPTDQWIFVCPPGCTHEHHSKQSGPTDKKQSQTQYVTKGNAVTFKGNLEKLKADKNRLANLPS